MADNLTTNLDPGFSNATDQTHVPMAVNEGEGILDKTLDEVLHTNPQAQQMIMQSMHLTPEKFQEMLQSAQSSNMMHMKIRDLFSQGVVQQAASPKPSFFQKILNMFKQ